MSPTTANLWIGGIPRPSSSGKTFDVINSVTQEVATRATAASSQDVIDAIETADKVQPSWEAVPWRVKRDIFIKAAELVKTKYAQRIIETVSGEIAALPNWGAIEVAAATSYFLEASAHATQLTGQTQPTGRVPGGTVLIERRPFGTIFSIAPFNSPVTLTARAIATPLACGNAVVLKSSELSPRSTEILVEVMYEVRPCGFVVDMCWIMTMIQGRTA